MKSRYLDMLMGIWLIQVRTNSPCAAILLLHEIPLPRNIPLHFLRQSVCKIELTCTYNSVWRSTGNLKRSLHRGSFLYQNGRGTASKGVISNTQLTFVVSSHCIYSITTYLEVKDVKNTSNESSVFFSAGNRSDGNIEGTKSGKGKGALVDSSWST